jgi:hypothetical protein
MDRMKSVMEIAASIGSHNKWNGIYRQLLIHGFTFGHECLALNIVEPAKHLFRTLLPHSSGLDDFKYGLEKAAAYQEYGLLLLRGKEWQSSAEQLLSACKLVLNHEMKLDNSRKPDHRLLILLKNNCFALLPHLANAPGCEKSIRDILEEMISYDMDKGLSYFQNTEQSAQPVLAAYLESDLPRDFANLHISEFLNTAQITAASIAAVSSNGSNGRVSTESASIFSGSTNSNGVTYPGSDTIDLMFP